MNGLPRWDQVLTQLRIIHNWVTTAIQWMVHWWVLVYCGPSYSTRGVHYFIKNFQSWAVWKHNMTQEMSAKHPAAIIFPLVKFWARSTENFNPCYAPSRKYCLDPFSQPLIITTFQVVHHSGINARNPMD